MALSKATHLPYEKNFPVQVRVEKFHVIRPDRRGYNKVYESQRSRSYLFELDQQIFFVRKHQLKNIKINLPILLLLHTNDNVNTSSFNYNSSSIVPNIKYCISLLLTHFFKLQKVIPKRIQNKFFPFLRQKLLDRIDYISRCTGINNTNNHNTKLFLIFCIKNIDFI